MTSAFASAISALFADPNIGRLGDAIQGVLGEGLLGVVAAAGALQVGAAEQSPVAATGHEQMLDACTVGVLLGFDGSHPP